MKAIKSEPGRYFDQSYYKIGEIYEPYLGGRYAVTSVEAGVFKYEDGSIDLGWVYTLEEQAE